MEPPPRTPSVHEAELRLGPGVDPSSVGAAVTVELCGAVDHEGPCRWPNHHAIDVGESGTAVFRTLFVAPEVDMDDVHRRISSALRDSSDWSVASERRPPLTSDEEMSAARLDRTGRTADGA
jgi:hypothetical protein